MVRGAAAAARLAVAGCLAVPACGGGSSAPGASKMAPSSPVESTSNRPQTPDEGPSSSVESTSNRPSTPAGAAASPVESTSNRPRTPPPAPVTAAPATPGAPAPAPTPAEIVEIAYRVERRVSDDATAGFEDLVEATLSDPRGWSRAGFRLVRRDDAPYLVVLAEGPEVDQLCLPHDTYGEYSCQRSETVALNAERWREATPKWTGDLATYRQMLVNHEVGHLLGQPHPRQQCPGRGQLAPLMAQQSTELDGCLPNPWPLDWEVAAAARHDRPLAPL